MEASVGRLVHAFFRPVTPHPRGRVRWAAVWLAAIGLALMSAADTDVDLGRALGVFGEVPLAAAGGLPLLLIRTNPALGWLLSAAAALVVEVLVPWTGSGPFPWSIPHAIALLALLLAVCAGEPVWRSVVAAVASAALFGWALPGYPAVGWVMWVAGVAAIGILVGMLRRQTRRSEHEQARRVVLEERARIARDLHDVVAHHMSLIVVRTETAPYRVGDLSDGAREEITAIGATARSALAETRALLAVLRRSDDEPESGPQPDLGRLDELLDGARAAGVSLTAEIEAPWADLRPGVSLAAYRIVQEALANSTRHAPGMAVHLVLRRTAEQLLLHVDNAAVTEPGPPGHGITGMRERAHAEGGTLAATFAGGRFTVEATLPVGARP